MTVKTRYALSLTAGSSATCMAALPHHLGEKAIPYSGIGFCERDSAIVESRTELITDSLNRTSHPFRRNVEPAAPQAQPLAGFAKDEVSWLRLAGAGNPCQAVGALRAGLPAASAERFARLYLHTHAMAAVACFPLSVFVDQEHWPTISSIRTLGAHSVSSGATVSRNAGFVRPGSKPPFLITFSRAPPLLFSITRTTQESATGQRNNPAKEGCPTRAPPARGRTVAHQWLFWANPIFVAPLHWRAFLVMAFIPNSAPTLGRQPTLPASSL